MDKDLMEQLYYAMLASREHKKTQFVYREQKNDHWWHSGFLPVEAMDFFVLYPSGEFDKSSEAPEFMPAEWSTFVVNKEAEPRVHLDARQVGILKDAYQAFAVAGDIPDVYETLPNAPAKPWVGFHDIFLGFCAFAPFALLGMALRFAEAFSTEDPWTFAWPIVITCLPFTLYMLYRTMSHANPKVGWTSSTLLCDSHMVLYGITCFMSKLVEFPDVPRVDYRILMVVMLLSMMGSGIALMLLWDDKRKVVGK